MRTPPRSKRDHEAADRRLVGAPRESRGRTAHRFSSDILCTRVSIGTLQRTIVRARALSRLAAALANRNRAFIFELALEHPGMPHSAYAALLDVSPAHITWCVAALEAEGLVTCIKVGRSKRMHADRELGSAIRRLVRTLKPRVAS